MKTKNLLFLSIYFLLLTFFSSCDKTDDPPANEEKLIVHLSGESYDGTSYRATYWKNGEKTFLQETGKGGYATSLKVKDGDVYIGGVDYTVQPSKAVIWKNGKLDQTINSTSKSYGVQIEFSGKDLFACTAEESEQVVYYKNNVKTASHAGQLYGFTMSGNDLYACGNLQFTFNANDGPLRYPVYWKNGNLVKLSEASEGLFSSATEMKISANDIFISGYIDFNSPTLKDEAILWKNGVKTVLPSTGPARAENVILHGNDVYVVGWSSDEIGGLQHATYWKNGVKTVLDNSTKFSGLYDLAISKTGVVYALGYLDDDSNGALWVNGKLDGTINGSPIGSIYNIVLEEK
jgi:hypothetical protein